jgi:2-oxoglutarate ferredoxin oxidoreductase subunit gamma
MREAIFMSGRGGHGILLAGTIVAEAAMQAGLDASWYPIYDPEVRGGRTTCMVVISDTAVGSPIAGRYSVAVLMDEPAVEQFLPQVNAGGVALVNSSLAQVPADAPVRVVAVPVSQMAEDLGDERVANMFAAATGALSVEQLTAALPTVLAERHHKLIPLNRQAMEAGYEAAQAAMAAGGSPDAG